MDCLDSSIQATSEETPHGALGVGGTRSERPVRSWEPSLDTDRPEAQKRAIPWPQLVLVTLVGVGSAWAWATGRLEAIDLPLIRAWVDGAGAWAPLAYLVAFGLLQPVGVASHLFLVVAGVVWPTPSALVLSQVGLLISSATTYGVGRAMAPESLRARMPARLRAMEDRLRAGGVLAVIAVRIPFFSFFLASAFMGALRVPFRTYMLGSFLGMLPVGVAEVLMAHELAERFGGL